MNFIKQKSLLLVVFITGACVLVLEVVAVRILSPFFGNTIYSYSSILSVILGALSAGYYLGGTYADKHPDYEHFFKLILYSGLTVLLLQFLVVFVVPGIAYDLPLTTGPLAISALLFAFPSFLLGMLSPYAIKLQDVMHPKEGVGKLSGEVFFYSTIGSIAGSLLTGFVLIPNFGIQRIVIGTGVVLIALGALGLLQYRVKKKTIIALSVLSLLLVAFIESATSELAPNVVTVTDGIYERIAVMDTSFRGVPTRLLMQDRSASSAINKETGGLVFEYAPYYQLYKLTDRKPSNALFIGAGAYTFPKALLADIPDVPIDVVEIEPKLYDISKKYFGLPETDKLHVHTEDGRRFLHDTTNTYDYIYSDVYSTVYSLPTHLATREYFELVKSRMSKDGIFIANVIGDLAPREHSLALSEIKTFKEVFPNSYFFAVNSPNQDGTQNNMFLAVNNDKPLDLTKPVVIDTVTNAPIDLQKQRINIEALNLNNQIVFTDSFAPIEFYTAEMLKHQSDKPEDISNAGSDKTLSLIKEQVDFGPRYPGSEGHKKMVEWLDNQLSSIGKENAFKQTWKQKGTKGSYDLTNFIYRINPEADKRIIIGTHYDTLKTSVDTGQPIPGANNGASATAVLLNAARSMQQLQPKADQPLAEIANIGIDFVFFDAEEGDPDLPIGGYGWTPWGSSYFTKNLSDYYKNQKPDHAVILDVVCSKNAEFYYETNSQSSAPAQMKKFWDTGFAIAPDLFHKERKYSVTDDHTVLIKAGIPGFLIIDFDYPPIHSTTDTIDKCSSETFSKMEETLITYLRGLEL